jgi:uncharacterized protein (TIGR02452 family)
MNQQKAIQLAQETQEIVAKDKYCVGEHVSSLIHPDDWDDIIAVAKSRPRLHEGLPIITVEPSTTLQAIKAIGDVADYRDFPGDDVMALNFASATTPGGGWLRGTTTQEETLARSSDLTAGLEKWPRYYRENKHKQQEYCVGPYYTEYAIYSHGVTFFRNDLGDLVDPYQADVMTIPAPNLSAVPTECMGKARADVFEILDSRINNILAAAAFYHRHYLVLGAWGCGVFKNNPVQVAEFFRSHLHQWGGYFKQVVFAIHDTSQDQTVMKAFRDTFPLPKVSA